LTSALRGQGLSASLAEKKVADVEKAVLNVLQDPKGQWIMSNHQDARSEFPLTGWMKDRFEQRIIDRTFIDDGVRWIIDFKTGFHEGANLQEFLDQEKKRYKNQLEQYEELFKIMGETRPIKKALYYPMHRKFVIVN
jgi:ATP-dependent exoDNAse (exonuclease V) beta subunit